MSLMLKGIDMPKDYTLVIAITQNGGVWQVNPIGRNEQLEAQAIQIPKDHGNIIDKSKAVVIETIDGYYEITAPTILEAED